MTEYTDEADHAIRDAPRTVQPGDLVTHKHVPYGVFGRVFAVDDDGTSGVQWEGREVRHGVPTEQLTFIERPEAYMCLEFNGHDEIDDTDISYACVATGSASEVLSYMGVLQRTDGYTVVNSFIPEPPVDEDVVT
jgi:hypothetical protein